MSDEKQYFNVKNRSAGVVVYSIPELANLRREYMPGETKKVLMEEIEKLTYVPGGTFLLSQYLQVDPIINEKLSINKEPEYNMSEVDVIELIKNGKLDQWLDVLDFAPVGVMDLIKKFSVTVPLTDTNKIEALKQKTGFDAALAIKNDRLDKEPEEPAFKPANDTAKSAETAQAVPTGRRTTSKYKIVTPTTE